MNKEKLMQAGLTAEQAEAVLKMHKEFIDGSYVTKESFNAELDKIKDLKGEIEKRDGQIAELGKFKGDADALSAKVGDLEKKNAADKQAYELKLKQQSEMFELKQHLTGKVIDPDDVIGKLEMDKLVFNQEGKLVAGLDVQLEAIKKSKPHWFPQEGTGGEKGGAQGWQFTGITPQDGKGGGDQNDDSSFGKQLAQQRLGSNKVIEKAAEHYFK